MTSGPSHGRRLRGDPGISTVANLVILAVPILFLLSLIVLAGRFGVVRADLESVSRDAARAASRQHDWIAAVNAAHQAAIATTQTTGCQTIAVDVADPSSFSAGGRITVTVTCSVGLSDIALPGIPGTRDVTATSTEVIDRHRSIE